MNSSQSKNDIIENNQIRSNILQELSRLGNGSPWLWKIFFLCITPGILNGLHVSSYVFLGQVPNDYYCMVPELVTSNWTNEQIRNISSTNGDSCHILMWDYEKLSEMSFEEAILYTDNMIQPNKIECLQHKNAYFHYEQEDGISIVPEWNLVCSNNILRTTVQVALSTGKFIGAFLFGIIADKYGRKFSFIIGAIFYIISGPLAAFVPWYWFFVIARVGIGMAGSGVYHSAYTILTETTSIRHRSWMSMIYSVSYPIGMLILALTAYYIRPWRYLQLALSIPAILLVFHCYFLIESPRWLMNKNKINKVHKIVFRKKLDDEAKFLGYDQQITTEVVDNFRNPSEKSLVELMKESIKEACKELLALYGPRKLRKRLLICHFTWCVTSLSYYAIALNADNFSADRYLYVAITGLVEIPSYILPIFLLQFFGRKITALLLFIVAGLSLLAVLVIPQDNTDAIIAVAMFGRLCISAVFAVVILHTAELFPTEIRNSAIGTSSTMAHVGSISAPYIVDLLGSIAWFIPTTICGVAALIAGFLVLMLPETKGKELNDTVEQETTLNSD